MEKNEYRNFKTKVKSIPHGRLTWAYGEQVRNHAIHSAEYNCLIQHSICFGRNYLEYI